MFRSQLAAAATARTLAAAEFAGAIGTGAYLVTSAVYFTEVVGLSATRFGIGLTVGWGVGSASGLLLGHLAVRLGPRRVAVALAVATALGVAAMPIARSLVPLILVMCVFASSLSGLHAARQALLAQRVPARERTSVRAHLQSAANAGLSLGAIPGGLALWAQTPGAFTAAFTAAAASFAGAAVLLHRVSKEPTAPLPAATGGSTATVLRDRPYMLIALLNTVMLLYMPVLSLLLPLWIVRATTAPAWTAAALLAFNTLAVVLFQVRFARPVVDVATATRSIRFAGLLLLASCAVYAMSQPVIPAWAAAAILLAGTALLVSGEMLLAAGTWELSFTFAPAGLHGQYQGLFGAGTPIARVLGPVLLTTVVLEQGTLGWAALGVLFLATALALTPAARWAERTRPSPADRRPRA